EFKRIFRRLDNNGDGRVSAAELGRAMKLMGKNPTKKDMKEVMEQARAIMTQVDKNGDGYMQYPEFERIMAGVSVDIDYEKELLIGAFKKFDLNGDGFISKEELMKVLTKMGDKMPEEEAEAMVKEADLNGDGLISYDGKFIHASNISLDQQKKIVYATR
ncbi:hypothetical protein FSP39_004527, partial [Pinctada imbricata]